MKFFTPYQFLLCFLSIIFSNYAKAQYISVDTSLNDQDLVSKFIGTQNCITVSGVFISGSNIGTDPSYGYFTKNGSTFDIDEGIILSTGSARAAEGPNTYRQDNGSSGWGGDIDLANVFGTSVSNYKNATYLEFDFVSNESNAVSFQYMFLSEEYDVNKTNGCNYSDAFAFLIKPAAGTQAYTNIALVPGTNDPVSVINIRGYSPTSTCQPKNEDYFGIYNAQSSASTSPTNFNGQTKVLTAVANVQVGVTYHIKLVIADEGTVGHDSAVLLKTGSFTGNVDIGNDLTLDNADPLCENTPYRIQPNPAISDPSAKYSWFKNGVAITTIPQTQAYYDVLNEEGDFSVKVVLGSGCKLEGQVKIEKAPIAVVNTAPIAICDSNFDGKYSAKLSDFNSQILTNFSRDFKISYYNSLSPTATPIDPDIDFVFTSNPQTLYVSIGAFSCNPKIYPVQFYYGNKLTVKPVTPYDVCDSDLSGNEQINLADYITEITNETGVTPTYFSTEAQAKAGGTSTINSLQTITASRSFFIRIEKAGSCPNYKEVKFNFKQPKKSTSLPGFPISICKGETKVLDAGLGFTTYDWYDEAAPTVSIGNKQTITLGVGNYFVILTAPFPNDCGYKQSVKILEAIDPVIDNVLIEGTTVTVLASGGTAPYQYSLDNGSYQSSNIFTNVDLGSHTVSVQDTNGCSVITKDFSLINIQNIITPNHDGINDVINYSSLLTKLEPRFEIYDRYGILVFKGDTNNQFVWDGTFNGRMLPTSTYWYIIEWNESGNPQRVQFSGWILLKNRN